MPARHPSPPARRAQGARALNAPRAVPAAAVIAAAAAALATLPACRHGDSVTYPVIGLGLVTVTQPADRGDQAPALRVSRTQMAGVLISAGAPVTGLVAGVLSVQSVQARTDAEVLVESIVFRDGKWIVTVAPARPAPPAASPANPDPLPGGSP